MKISDYVPYIIPYNSSTSKIISISESVLDLKISRIGFFDIYKHGTMICYWIGGYPPEYFVIKKCKIEHRFDWNCSLREVFQTLKIEV